MRFLRNVFYGLGFFCSVAFAASTSEPVAFMENISHDFMVKIDLLSKNTPPSSAVQKLVEERIMPYVDMPQIGRLVLGAAFNQASAQEKQEFLALLQKRLITTYSRAFDTNQPLRLSAYRLVRVLEADGSRVELASLLTENGQEWQLNYRLVKSEQGWRVYDVTINNVSMVRSLRSQLMALASQRGIQAVIKELQDNKPAETSGRNAGDQK